MENFRFGSGRGVEGNAGIHLHAYAACEGMEPAMRSALDLRAAVPGATTEPFRVTLSPISEKDNLRRHSAASRINQLQQSGPNIQ